VRIWIGAEESTFRACGDSEAIGSVVLAASVTHSSCSSRTGWRAHGFAANTAAHLGSAAASPCRPARAISIRNFRSLSEPSSLPILRRSCVYGLRCCHRPTLLASTRRDQFVEQQRPLKLKRRLLDIGIS
jgi:hypothetical protein